MTSQSTDKDLDHRTARQISKLRDPDSKDILDTIILVANATGDKKLINPGIDELSELLNEIPELDDMVQAARNSGSFKSVREHPALQVKLPVEDLEDDESDRVVLSYQQENAVVQAWHSQYRGTAAEALLLHISAHFNHPRSYARYCAIVQSSGMGKSRTVDELGYPPPDTEIRDFLIATDSHPQGYFRAAALLQALFEHLRHVLETHEDFRGKHFVEFPLIFRNLMTNGGNFSKPNEFRRKFFSAVRELAEKHFKETPASTANRGHFSPSSKQRGQTFAFPPAHALSELLDFCREAGCKDYHSLPILCLAFDEAHFLTKNMAGTRSRFADVRLVLRGISDLPCFSLFLSTTGKSSQFTPPPEDDSNRLHFRNLTLIQPFSDLGFDVLAHKIPRDSPFLLTDAASMVHMVHLGRPLFASVYDSGDESVVQNIVGFAAAKLLNVADVSTVPQLSDDQQLACIAQRIPIEFNSTTFFSQSRERKQVEGHLRICLKIDATFESMVTTSASEPLLSEAAYAIIDSKAIDIPEAMKLVFKGFAINKGLRGEFIAMLLLTMARDMAVGPPGHQYQPSSRIFRVGNFITGCLFRTDLADDKVAKTMWELSNQFFDCNMHFNHFIKVHDLNGVTAERLILLATRGAGVLCGNSQRAIDGVNVFFRGNEMSVGNLGLIVWQVKNDAAYSRQPQQELFVRMDPYTLKILENPQRPVPIIKIFFALAARVPGLSVSKIEPTPEYDAPIYEIWCAGLDAGILAVVDEKRSGTWASLLQASYGWKEIYKGGEPSMEDLRRSMNPGAAIDAGHWGCWVEEQPTRDEASMRSAINNAPPQTPKLRATTRTRAVKRPRSPSYPRASGSKRHRSD